MDMTDFDKNVWELVRAIPPGAALSYGQIARLLGAQGLARRVGRAMRYAPQGVPCHRVLNARGEHAPGWTEQWELLRGEGAPFLPDGRVDMRQAQNRAREALRV